VGNNQTGYSCDGAGVCQSNTTTECGLRACNSGACTPTCANDEDCAPTAYCQVATGTCVVKNDVGTACSGPSTCKSGYCVDGLCCNEACGGQCQACDVPTAPGMCSPVVGQPHGVRDACPAATNGDVCTGRACDGAQSTASCVGYVGAEVPCRDETCINGVETFSATCNGAGQCGAQGNTTTKVCQPYVCKGNACGAAPCSGDNDCAPDFRCDPMKQDCVARNVATCNDHIVTAANGKDTTDCTPYRCEASGTCKKACALVDDCAAGFVCAEDHTCAPLGSGAGGKGGCSTGVGQTDPSWGTMIFGAMLAASGLRRARRRKVR
jgi:MYXO-CTERM domain-containing protein